MREKLLSSLYPYRRLLCVQEDGEMLDLMPPASKEAVPSASQGGRRPSYTAQGLDYRNPEDPEFKSPYSPTQMRCLALVSHNNMKSTMKEFVVQNANVLKKFRLTGTASTMKMLAQVFKGDPKVVYGYVVHYLFDVIPGSVVFSFVVDFLTTVPLACLAHWEVMLNWLPKCVPVPWVE